MMPQKSFSISFKREKTAKRTSKLWPPIKLEFVFRCFVYESDNSMGAIKGQESEKNCDQNLFFFLFLEK